MYDNVKFFGKTLKEWSEALKHEFSMGELYRMMQAGEDFRKYASRRGIAVE